MLHWVVHTKSDTVRNDKRELEKKIRSCIFSLLCTPDQSLHEEGHAYGIVGFGKSFCCSVVGNV